MSVEEEPQFLWERTSYTRASTSDFGLAWLNLKRKRMNGSDNSGQQLLVRPNFGSSRLYVEEYVTENDRSPTPSDQRNEQQRR